LSRPKPTSVAVPIEEQEENLHITIIFPVVLYVCENRSLTLSEERRLTVFENRVMKRIFGPGIEC